MNFIKWANKRTEETIALVLRLCNCNKVNGAQTTTTTKKQLLKHLHVSTKFMSH